MQYNILALLSPGDSIQELLFSEENVDICYIQKNKIDTLSRYIKRFKLLFPFDFFAYSADFLNKDLSIYDIVIIDETIYPERIIKYIRRNNPSCKIIYWMWNTVEYSGKLRLYKKWSHWELLLAMREYYNIEIISFDKRDCEKYDLTYNNQIAPFFRNLSIDNEINERVFFWGQDKNRLEQIQTIRGLLSNTGYLCDFNVVPDQRKKYPLHAFEGINKVDYLPYKEIIKRELKSSVLLEILQEKQNGLTWRALESLFYKKKLITNFEEIKKYDFYNPKNIYIIGVDDKSRLYDFMSEQYEDVPKSIIENYTLKGWLDKYINKTKSESK